MDRQEVSGEEGEKIETAWAKIMNTRGACTTRIFNKDEAGSQKGGHINLQRRCAENRPKEERGERGKEGKPKEEKTTTTDHTQTYTPGELVPEEHTRRAERDLLGHRELLVLALSLPPRELRERVDPCLVELPVSRLCLLPRGTLFSWPRTPIPDAGADTSSDLHILGYRYHAIPTALFGHSCRTGGIGASLVVALEESYLRIYRETKCWLAVAAGALYYILLVSLLGCGFCLQFF